MNRREEEDERIKARERQRRAASRVTSLPSDVGPVEPSAPKLTEPYELPVVSDPSTASANSHAWSAAARAPPASPTKKSAREEEEERIKARERQFRTSAVPNLASHVDQRRISGPKVVEPDAMVEPYLMATSSNMNDATAAAFAFRQSTPGVPASHASLSSREEEEERIKQRERQYRMSGPIAEGPKRTLLTETVSEPDAAVAPGLVASTSGYSTISSEASATAWGVSKKPSSVTSGGVAYPAKSRREEEDERMKQRERQFRSTMTTNPSAAGWTDPRMLSEPEVQEPDAPLPPDLVTASSNYSAGSAPTGSWGAVAKPPLAASVTVSFPVKNSREEEDQKIKQRERQFRSTMISNQASLAESKGVSTTELSEPDPLVSPDLVTSSSNFLSMASSAAAWNASPNARQMAASVIIPAPVKNNREDEEKRIKQRASQFRSSAIPDSVIGMQNLPLYNPSSEEPETVAPPAQLATFSSGAAWAVDRSQADNLEPTLTEPTLLLSTTSSSSDAWSANRPKIPDVATRQITAKSKQAEDDARMKDRERQFRSTVKVVNLSEQLNGGRGSEDVFGMARGNAAAVSWPTTANPASVAAPVTGFHATQNEKLGNLQPSTNLDDRVRKSTIEEDERIKSQVRQSRQTSEVDHLAGLVQGSVTIGEVAREPWLGMVEEPKMSELQNTVRASASAGVVGGSVSRVSPGSQIAADEQAKRRARSVNHPGSSDAADLVFDSVTVSSVRQLGPSCEEVVNASNPSQNALDLGKSREPRITSMRSKSVEQGGNIETTHASMVGPPVEEGHISVEQVAPNVQEANVYLTPKGAFSVLGSGIIQRHTPGRITAPTEQSGLNLVTLPPTLDSVTEEESCRRDGVTSDARIDIPMQETETGTEPMMAEAVVEDGKGKSSGTFPFYRSRMFLWIIGLVTLVVVAVAVAVPVAAGGKKNQGSSVASSFAPTPTPAGPGGLTPQQEARAATIRHYIEGSISSAKSLDDPASPQYSAFSWIVRLDNATASSVETNEEVQTLVTRYILAVFYYSLQGPSWLASNGWLEQIDQCMWQYITCVNSSVVSIDTGGRIGTIGGGSNLHGSLPSEIQHLESLGMSK